MNFLFHTLSRIIIFTGLFVCLSKSTLAKINKAVLYDNPPTSTQLEAIQFIDGITSLKASSQWPKINPVLFLNNLKININNPLSLYPGIGTNFCGYGALSYLLLLDDPLGYAKFMIRLYNEGVATMGRSTFKPSPIIKRTAGTLKYKGILDVRPAEQMFYLTLADHFKGYLNIFNRHYDAGDENRFWASVNYAKFNRMLRSMLSYKVNAVGADLMKPWTGNTYDFISKKMDTGKVVLYLNNRILHKKKHAKIKLQIPTHFVILENISKTDDLVTLIYWDYGSKTLLQLKPRFLHKIVFGISQCIKKAPGEK